MTGKDPRWHRYIALAVFIAAAVAGWVFRARLGADFWPLDSSRVGPNLLASILQAGAVLVALSLLYPPFRRAAHRFFDRKLDGLHSRIDELHERHDNHADQVATLSKRVEALHRKLDKRS